MPVDILMPALSPTMTEGTLAKWLKSEGDVVKAGDVIAEIETDKATMEVEAVDEGKLGNILISAGTSGVAVNTPIAVLLEDGEDASAIKVGSAANANPPAASANAAPAPAVSAVAPSSVAPVAKGDRVFASPLARRVAEQKGIDLKSVQGSGPHGRIVKSDVENAKAGAPAPKAAAASAAPVNPPAPPLFTMTIGTPSSF